MCPGEEEGGLSGCILPWEPLWRAVWMWRGAHVHAAGHLVRALPLALFLLLR